MNTNGCDSSCMKHRVHNVHNPCFEGNITVIEDMSATASRVIACICYKYA